jgi:hypothetical protein
MRMRHMFDHVASGATETPVNFTPMYNRTGAAR